MTNISSELSAMLSKAANAAECAKTARENGIDVPEGTENEFYNKVRELGKKLPVSDDDLDSVAGGVTPRRPSKQVHEEL